MGKDSKIKKARRGQMPAKGKRKLSKWWLVGLIALVVAIVVTVIVLAQPASTSSEKTDSKTEQTDHSKHNHEKDDEKKKKEEPPPEPKVSTNWRLLKSPALTTEPIQLSFSFSNKKNQQIVNDFETYHDKKMHLIVVSTDLKDYFHIHPELSADGRFISRFDLKRSTTYKLFADGRSASLGEILDTAGLYVRDPKDLPKDYDPKKTKLTVPPDVPAKLTVDSDQVRTLNGLDIRLATENLQAGKQAKLTFSFKDAASGADVTDLQTYLGTVGHVVIVDEKASEFIHTHPIDEKQRGPKAEFSAEFKKAGKYKVWGEFKHNGKQLLVPYVIEVKP